VAKGVLINVTGSSSMTLHEVHEASSLIQEQAHEDARVIWGLVFDDSMEDTVRITVIATGFEEQVVKQQEDPIQIVRNERLFEERSVPTFMKRKVTIDYRDVKPKQNSSSTDLDDERYDLPTFLRKQAD
jgi:cell division protein FtsZ